MLLPTCRRFVAASGLWAAATLAVAAPPGQSHDHDRDHDPAHAHADPFAAPGAPPLDLATAVRHTLAGNPGLAALAFPLRAQQARIEAAGLKPPPTLDLQVENGLGTGRYRGFDGAEASFALSQVIEMGDQRQRRVEAADAARHALDAERAIAQLDVLAELGRRFIHVASDHKQLELTELATQLAGRTLAEVERRVKAARSPAVELHRARIALARAEVEQEHAEHELLTSRRKLAAMWGSREADFGPVRAELFVLPPVEDYDRLARRLADSPDFLRFATEARQREAELRLAEAKARSPVTLSAGLRWLRETDDAALVGGVALPLFGRRQAQPAIAEARALHEGVDASRQAAQVKAEASLFELVQELRHGITEAEMLRDRVLPQMEEALAATEYAWRRGRYGYLEWTEAQRERVEVQRALIEAAAKAHLFHVEIERLTGAAATADSPKSGVIP